MGKFGQFRSSQISSYGTALTVEMSRIRTASENAENVMFRDVCGKLSGTNMVNSNNCYYLKFWVKQRPDGAQSFTVKLLNSTLSEDNAQELADFTVATGTSSIYYELAFQPNATYDTIVLQLKRTSLDYSLSNLDSTSGRIMEANITNLDKLVNVIDYLKTNYSGLEYVKKIGVQGPTALMMCINGEQIRIGRNKIYEIHNDYKINFIGFVPNNSYFLMDFEY